MLASTRRAPKNLLGRAANAGFDAMLIDAIVIYLLSLFGPLTLYGLVTCIDTCIDKGWDTARKTAYGRSRPLSRTGSLLQDAPFGGESGSLDAEQISGSLLVTAGALQRL